MLMEFVSNHYCDKLSDTGQKQIGMKSFFILCLAASNAEAVFKVINGLFNIHTDFISLIPFR